MDVSSMIYLSQTRSSFKITRHKCSFFLKAIVFWVFFGRRGGGAAELRVEKKAVVAAQCCNQSLYTSNRFKLIG